MLQLIKKKIKTKKITSLYIHIPFCKNICYYCNFPKIILIKSLVKKYLKTLILELKSLKINHKLKTIYIGGGTPTCINLESLLKKLQPYLYYGTEFTIEGNIDDFNEKMLKKFLKYHVNRLSLGIQSTNNKILKILGRKHTKKKIFNKIKLIKKYFSNINIDLIYGFNELKNKILIEELQDYLSLNVNHISTYSLEINKGTIFFNQHKKESNDFFVRKQFDIIYQTFIKNNYIRYEISNFAKKKYQSKHNLNYWYNNEYYGIGLGAASYINNYRIKNTLNMNEYLKKNYIYEKEKITKNDMKKYFLMLNLRTYKGVNLIIYQKKFNENLLIAKKNEINDLIINKLLIIKNNNLLTTYNGSMLLDIILRKLF